MSRATDPLSTQGFSELAEAVRARVEQIVRSWERAVRRMLPSAHGLTFEQVRDDLPIVLGRMADALQSPHWKQTSNLFAATRAHGETRFHQDFDFAELLIEYRILRPVLIGETQQHLGRRLSTDESEALNLAVDITLEQAARNFFDFQQDRLRHAADVERRFLSFLSHDMRNNLNSLVLTLELLKKRLRPMSELAEEVAMLESGQEGIVTTVAGMERLLNAERLRTRPPEPKREPVNVAGLIADLLREQATAASRKGIVFETHVPEGMTVISDRELLMLVLQNLLGNAVKYSERGTVRLSYELCPGMGALRRPTFTVADQGPGIPPEQLAHVFESFHRGDTYGQEGVGLGLAIATHAAKLLDAELTVQSEVGQGSTFRLALPPA